MRILGLVVTVAAGILILASVGAQDRGKPPFQTEAQKPTDKVKKLQTERIATLKAVADVETRLFQNGKASPEAMVESKVLVCEAELDVAEKESERITALKSLVEVLKGYEEMAKAWKIAGEGTESAILKVRAKRLEAEIRLEKEQAQMLGQAKNAQPEHEKAIVISLKPKDVVISKEFPCQIHSRRHIDIRSQQSGYLEEIQVKEGQRVKQGDVMFKVAPLLYKAKLDAELAEVELATLDLKRTQNLREKKVVSEDEVAMSRAKLAKAQAKAKLAQAELDLTMVQAPFDGIIDRLQVQRGSLVTERDTLTTLSDNSVMWVYFNVAQSYYLEYMSDPAREQDAEVELMLTDGRKLSQPGKIAAIEAQFNKETGNIPFRADFPNPDGLLRHGMTGTLLIPQTLGNALVIPQQATFEVLGKRYVYVVDKEDMAHQREVVIQNELGDDFVVKEGLEVNDRIVVEGVRQVHDGEKLEYELANRRGKPAPLGDAAIRPLQRNVLWLSCRPIYGSGQVKTAPAVAPAGAYRSSGCEPVR